VGKTSSENSHGDRISPVCLGLSRLFCFSAAIVFIYSGCPISLFSLSLFVQPAIHNGYPSSLARLTHTPFRMCVCSTPTGRSRSRASSAGYSGAAIHIARLPTTPPPWCWGPRERLHIPAVKREMRKRVEKNREKKKCGWWGALNPTNRTGCGCRAVGWVGGGYMRE
jgi:hypothetical protein